MLQGMNAIQIRQDDAPGIQNWGVLIGIIAFPLMFFCRMWRLGVLNRIQRRDQQQADAAALAAFVAAADAAPGGSQAQRDLPSDYPTELPGPPPTVRTTLQRAT